MFPRVISCNCSARQGSDRTQGLAPEWQGRPAGPGQPERAGKLDSRTHFAICDANAAHCHADRDVTCSAPVTVIERRDLRGTKPWRHPTWRHTRTCGLLACLLSAQHHTGCTRGLPPRYASRRQGQQQRRGPTAWPPMRAASSAAPPPARLLHRRRHDQAAGQDTAALPWLRKSQPPTSCSPAAWWCARWGWLAPSSPSRPPTHLSVACASRQQQAGCRPPHCKC